MKSYLKFILQEGLHALRRCGWAGALTMCIMTMTLFVYGIFLFFTGNIKTFLGELKETRHVIVYVKKDITPENLRTLENSIRGISHLENFETITEEEALSIFKHQFGDEMADGLDENPLPASFEFNVSKDVQDIETIVKQIEPLAGISEIHYGRKTAKRISELGRIVNGTAILFSSILLFISLFIIANTIQLAVISKKEEIYIMQLVGATDGMIRWPFVFVGCVEGLISSYTALVILYIVYYSIIFKTSFFSILPIHFVFLQEREILYLIILAILMGIIGSILAVGKFLRNPNN